MKKILSFLCAFVMLFTLSTVLPANLIANAEETATFIIHYKRDADDYDDWNAWTWLVDGADGVATQFTDEDDFGKVAVFTAEVEDQTQFGFVLRKGDTWDTKDGNADRFADIKDGVAEIWVTGGVEDVLQTPPAGAEKYDLSKAPAPSVPSDKPVVDSDGLKVTIHYHRFDGNYDGWNFWLWGDGANGTAHKPTGKDDFGVVCETIIPGLKDATKFNYIVRKGEWEAKDGDIDRVSKVVKNADGSAEIWLAEGDLTTYYKQSDIDLSPKFKTAAFNSTTSLSIVVTEPFDKTDTDFTSKFTVKDSFGRDVKIKAVTSTANGNVVNSGLLLFDGEIDFDKSYTVYHEKYGEAEVTIGKAFNTEGFAEAFTFSGKLGALYSENSTSFVLWAPTASKVVLNLYKKGDGDNLIKSMDMTKGEKGTWGVKVNGDQNKVYYTYSVTVAGVTTEATDPYAQAAGVNGKRGMVIDLDSTDPEGWDKDKRPDFKNFSDAIVYETHIRDFSIDKSSGMINKGKYLAFTESGTVNSNGLSTGIDHLVDLGVTHVQLLPSFDSQSIDETKLDTPQFNWGYDPQNYNLPEGSYSSDPYNGEVRINEYKQMVQALHSKGIRVIMDVVYNHTGATGDSNLNKVVPNYYYRQTADGAFSNGSGCGNETASERSMMRKYIIDSVVYWATEYNIDGFRFDLMGIHDIETMNLVREALNKVDPSIIIYGEGWTGGTTGIAPSESALKANGKLLNGIGLFSDDIRDGMKGSVFNNAEQGFITGVDGKEETIKFGIVGAIQSGQIDYSKVSYSTEGWANDPYQSVNYAEAHDNLTLWDRIQTSVGDKASMEDKIKMDQLAASIVLTSQGVSFLQLGQDFLRSKPTNAEGTTFDENSYKSSDAVNSIKWDQKTEQQSTYEYYKGLIAFRNAHSGLRMMTAKEVNKNLKFMKFDDSKLVAYTIENNANKDISEKIFVAHNANNEAKTITLPEGEWEVYVRDDKAGTEILETVSGEIEVSAITSVILAQNTNLNANVEVAPSSNVLPIIIAGVALLVIAAVVTIIVILKKKRKAL